MINQKLISVKLKYNVLQRLDEEACLGCSKRNTLINDACELLVDLLDLRRTIRAYKNQDVTKEALKQFYGQWMPELCNFDICNK